MQLEERLEGYNKTNENTYKCLKKITGINRKSEIYEKMKTNSFCILMCSCWVILNTAATTAAGTVGSCSIVSFLSYSNFAYKSEIYNLA